MNGTDDPALQGFPGGRISSPVDDLRERGVGPVLVTTRDGRKVLVLVAIPALLDPDRPEIEPMVIFSDGPFPERERVVDFERFRIPVELLPEELRDPALDPANLEPQPDGDEAFRERRARRAEESERTVVITEADDPSGPRCVVRIYDGAGGRPRVLRIPGAYSIAERLSGGPQKLLVVQEGAIRRSILIDVQAARKILDTTAALAPDALREAERLRGGAVVFEQVPGDDAGTAEALVRIRGLNPDGSERFVLSIPGRIIKVLPNNARSIKSIITQFEGKIYNDLIRVTKGEQLTADARGVAENAITGEFVDAQYHRVDDQDRFLAAAYDEGRDQTEVRILDEAGAIVGTVVLRGRLVGTRAQMGRKTFITEERGLTEEGGATFETIVDLKTGREIP